MYITFSINLPRPFSFIRIYKHIKKSLKKHFSSYSSLQTLPLQKKNKRRRSKSKAERKRERKKKERKKKENASRRGIYGVNISKTRAEEGAEGAREREAKKIEAAERSLGGEWWRVDGGNGSLGIALSISGPLCNPPLLTPAPTLGNRRLHSIPFHPFSTAENHPRNSPFLLPPPPPSAAREGRGGREGVPLARKLYPHSRRRAARLSLSLARSPLAARYLSLCRSVLDVYA